MREIIAITGQCNQSNACNGPTRTSMREMNDAMSEMDCSIAQ
jgi:hypothetical protein